MSSAAQILQGLYTLIGHDSFNAALQELQTGQRGTGTIRSVESARLNLDEDGAKKTRTKPTVSAEETARRSNDMRAMQAFTQYVRTELPAETSYKDAQIAAGVRWKALSLAEKAKWKEPAVISCIVCSSAIENTDAHRACVRQYIERRGAEGCSVDDAIQEFLQGS